jgi:hypothetical protein
MASILKRNDKWFVRVRKHEQPSQSKTFTVKQDAQRLTVMILPSKLTENKSI